MNVVNEIITEKRSDIFFLNQPYHNSYTQMSEPIIHVPSCANKLRVSGNVSVGGPMFIRGSTEFWVEMRGLSGHAWGFRGMLSNNSLDSLIVQCKYFSRIPFILAWQTSNET
jgi:hypothetical protein